MRSACVAVQARGRSPSRGLGNPMVRLCIERTQRSRPFRLARAQGGPGDQPAEAITDLVLGRVLPSFPPCRRARSPAQLKPRTSVAVVALEACWLLHWQAIVPFIFRIQVSHQTQKLTSEFLPATPGIRQDASWRTTCLY